MLGGHNCDCGGVQNCDYGGKIEKKVIVVSYVQVIKLWNNP